MSKKDWVYSAPFDVGEFGLRRVISIASEGKVLAHVNCGFGDGAGEKLARVMAAAPDMVKALEQIAALTHKGDTEVWRIATTLLAKAGV